MITISESSFITNMTIVVTYYIIPCYIVIMVWYMIVNLMLCPRCPRPGSPTLENYAQSSLLTLPLLTLLDSNSRENSLWAWEFHPLELRLCLSQTF